MKKIISIIVVLALAIIVISLVSNKKAPVTTPDTTTDTTISTSTAISLGDIKIADGSYSVKPSDATITWTGRKVVLKNWIDSGKINLKEMVFEVKDGKISSNKFIIDMTSIAGVSTGAGGGQDKLTTHLKSADFFDVVTFPTSTFVAKEFTASTTKPGLFIVKGDLTIKGTTNEISIPATINYSDGKTLVIKGTATVDRTLWNIQYGSGKFFKNLGDNVIADNFTLDFDIKISPAIEAI